MADEIVAAIAAEETERAETAGDTAVELARIEQETQQSHDDAAVAMVEAQAGAAVAIAEAQEPEIDAEWLRSEFARLSMGQAEMQSQMATMAKAISTLAASQLPPMALTPTPEASEAEASETTVIVEPETVNVVADGPRENREDQAGEPAPTPRRKLAWM